MTEEQRRVESFGRLEDGLRAASPWYWWGPYVSERQWGTVREDYSADGNAWDYLPFDAARSTAYRWGEDGLAGFCDVEQNLCLGLALWNGLDPFLKERLFGLNQSEANHGEDVKEYWWYHDAVPSHAWNVWRYHYPQGAFPYDDLRAVNKARTLEDPEYELLDTGIFDEDRYWAVEVRYAKADPTDLCWEVEVTNVGPDRATLHVLPTAWFRNTWSWDDGCERPSLVSDGDHGLTLHHPWLGTLQLTASMAPDGGSPTTIVCENESGPRAAHLTGAPSAYPKDGINDHVVTGAATVNPSGVGTKGAFWYVLEVEPGSTATVRLRLQPHDVAVAEPTSSRLGDAFSDVMAAREADADAFYAPMTPESMTPDERLVLRQAFAGMLWGKQLYYYDVARWLDGDPTRPLPPPSRDEGRNARWRNFNAFDIMSMPDKWEYPWFAAWDLAFHCVALARVDPAFAKYQLILLCREWFQHPSGGLPAYEWDFGDLNPPVQAWAALEVYAIDGERDHDFLSRVFDKLLVNFTWWVNREDVDGSNLFEGGFLGLDNIGPIDRSHLPPDYILRQADATGWMAAYSLVMGVIASILNRSGARPTGDLVLKFLEHFALVRTALNGLGLWNDEDGFFYDQLEDPDGTRETIAVHSMVGAIPLLASMVLNEEVLVRAVNAGKRCVELLGAGARDLDALEDEGVLRGEAGERRLLLGVVEQDRVERLVARLLDETEFLSPHGLRSLSAFHRAHPYEIAMQGYEASINYEPAESTTRLFGGNSNWRGPVWFPLNYLACNALERLGRFFGDDMLVEFPTGSGARHTYDDVAMDLRRRLISLFLIGPDGRRPCFGDAAKFRDDPRWRDNLLFNEYFDGDTGKGLGASHQTGWTGLVADLLLRVHGVGATGQLFLMDEGAGVVRAARVPTTVAAATPTVRRSMRRAATSPSPRSSPTPSSCACSTGSAARSEWSWRAATVPRGGCTCRAWSQASATGTVRTGRWPQSSDTACDPTKLLLDPCARAFDGAMDLAGGPWRAGDGRDTARARADLDRGRRAPRLGDGPSRRLATPGRTPSSTRSTCVVPRCATPTCPSDLRGTYAGLAHDAFVEHLARSRRDHRRAAPRPRARRRAVPRRPGLTNYWGYNPIGLFAPTNALLGGGDGRGRWGTGGRVQGDGRGPAPRADRGRARRRLQPHRRGGRRRAAAEPARPRRSLVLPPSMPTATCSTRRAAATRSTPRARSRCG